jgi:hypothetical protein
MRLLKISEPGYGSKMFVLDLAANAEVNRATVSEAVLGQRRHVLAAGSDERVGELRAEACEQRTLDGPLARKHGGKADDIGIAWNARDDFVERQPLTDVPRMPIEVPIPVARDPNWANQQ